MSATLCLSFDNLGEAAEIGVGALAPDDPGIGSHPSATERLPWLLDRLDARGLPATFFVEGLNAQIYPALLQEVHGRGHEVAYHAWAHEQWDELSAGAQAENLARGLAACEGLGIELAGIRPPGGGLGEGGLGVIRDAGLRYCSPAGSGAGAEQEVALLPFRWRHVDVSCTLPQLAAVREEIAGAGAPLGPDAFLADLGAALARLAEEGGFATFVLHPFMVEAWLGEERLDDLLERVAAARRNGALEVATFRHVAAQVLSGAGGFEGVALDPRSWSG